jgi:hypothetical protein
VRPPWFIIGRTAKPSSRRRPVNSALGSTWGQAGFTALLAARHEVTLANRVALGQAGSTLLPQVSPTRPAFRLRRAAIRPPTPAARRAHSLPPPARLANVAGRCLTCRSTGRATARHPGREAPAVNLAPRGQGASPPRAGYLYVRQHMGSGKFHGSSRRSARSHPCQPCRAWTGRLCAPASSQSHAARLPAPPCSHPAASNGCAAGSLTSTIYSLAHPRSALPNLSVNRSANGWPPCPRAARCLSCASRARRPPVVARLPLR